jgi:hypothetical protein
VRGYFDGDVRFIGGFVIVIEIVKVLLIDE